MLKNNLRVLSLFDGISCGQYSLSKLGASVNKYYASEIDKYAISVTMNNFPETIQLGDVSKVRQLIQLGVLTDIDMLIGGSPCTDVSFAGKQSGIGAETLEEYKRLVSEGFEFKGQSYLFWEYVWIKELLNPKYFLLENVRMKKETLNIFNKVMGVEGVMIDSALVSAQSRKRYYWCNWSVSQPEDRHIYLKDIIETGVVDRDKSYCLDASYYKGGTLKNYHNKARRQIVFSSGRIVGRKINPDTGRRDDYNKNLKIEQRLELRKDNKAGCLTTVSKDSVITDNITYRKLTPVECERLQGLDDNYTNYVSNTQRYKMLGNGWQCDTIMHILSEVL